MSKIGDIHNVPISEYKKAYNLIQAFMADFQFNDDIPVEKAILIDFMYSLTKNLKETKVDKILEENKVTDKVRDSYFQNLTAEYLQEIDNFLKD